MYPPNGAIPNRARNRKATAKLSFLLTSTGNSSLPCQPRANFTHLIALPPTAQKGEGHECWPVLTVNATEKTGLITATTTGENNEGESVHRRKLLAKSCDATTSKLVLHPSSTGAYEQVVIVEKPGRRALTESGVPDMVETREGATAALLQVIKTTTTRGEAPNSPSSRKQAAAPASDIASALPTEEEAPKRSKNEGRAFQDCTHG
ncbi:hypothetical protein HPB50_027622 [Hyalomma asiaticum]|nr:hypothetical protein HPB50_027622 [Hyalomma asiaticum]